MNITALVREVDSGFDNTKPTSKSNPGGGVTTKVRHLQAALPNIQFISDIIEAGTITIIEPLWFSDGGKEDAVSNRIDRYKASKSFKILWTSDVQFARWQGHERDEIFGASDVIAGNSKYFTQMLKVYAPDSILLTDPVDTDSIVPNPIRKNQIVGMGNVIIQKRVDTLIKVYKKLPKKLGLKKGYIGSNSVWGDLFNTQSNIKLDNKLLLACDWVKPYLNRAQVDEEVGRSWGYLAATGYDSFCYAMIEFMLAGAWLFCGRHLIYDERPCFRFETVDQAVELIKWAFEELRGKINEEGRQYVIDNYSLKVFRNQLKEIVGGGYGF